MDINYEIWGAPKTWQDITAALAVQGELKIGEASHTTYNNAWTSERLPWNSFDKSPAFWGIGKKSILCNPHYIAPYCNSGDITDIDVYTEPVTTAENQPCIFTKNADSVLSPRWAYRYKPWETPSSSPSDPACSRDVILSFNYQKVILVPYVIVTTDSYTSGGTSSYTLYDYVENARYTTYQQVLGFGYILRFGDGIDSNRTSQTNGYLMPIISYDIGGRNIYYNNHPFYAHTTGMSILAWHRLDDLGISIDRVRGDATVGTEDTGFRWRYCPTNDGTSVPWFFYDPDEPLWEINKKTHTASGVTYWYAYPCIRVNANNIDAVKSYIMSQIAFLGLPFVYNPTDANRGKIGDIGVYLPKFDGDGITTGEYAEGKAALALPNAEWVDGRTGIGYDPTKPSGGDENEGIKVRPSTPAFTLAGHGTKCYALIESDIDEIFDDIYGRSSSSWSKLINGLQMFGADPMGAIISFKWYPYSFSSTTNSAVYLGNTAINPLHQYPVIDATTNSYKSTTATYKWDVKRNFVNSRKTTCRLYLPFYGFYELPLPLIISKTLSVYMAYNVPDELAVWIISFDDVVYDFVECDPSIDIPLTGSNAAQIALTKRNTALSIATQVGATAAAIAVGATMQAPALGAAVGELGAIYSGAGTIGGVISSLPWLEASSVRALATGGAAAAGIGAGGVASGANILNRISNAKVQIGHLMTNLPHHGAASSTTFLNLPMYPYIQFIQNVKMQGWNEAEYKIKVGIACDKWVTTSSMPANSLLQTTGIANMPVNDLELAEVQELNEILQSGFCK